MMSVGLWCARAGVVAMSMCVGLAGAAWEQTSGPEGGVVTAMAEASDSLWAATYMGVHASGDSGRTWAMAALPLDWVRSLHTHGGLLYAGTQLHGLHRRDVNGQWDTLNGGWSPTASVPAMATWRGQLFVSTGSRIYSSGDGGTTWTAGDSATPAYFGTMVAHPDFLFAGTHSGGVFRSNDSGNSWIPADNGLPASPRVQALFAADTVVYVSLQSNGLYRSVDGGDNWTASMGPSGQLSCAAMAHSGDTVYVITPNQGVFRGLGYGASWVACLDTCTNTEAGAIHHGGRLVVSYADRIRMSDDGGVQWQAAEKTIISTRIPEIALQYGTVLTSVQRFGVRRTADYGATWTESETRLVPSDIVALGSKLFGHDASAIVTSLDSGTTWSVVTHLGNNVTSLVTLDDTLYAGTGSHGVWRSLDSGATWDTLNTGLPDRNIKGMCAVSGRLLASVNKKGIYRLDNGTWVDSDSGIAIVENYRRFVAFAVRDSSVMASAEHGTGDHIFVSHDAGETWSPIIGSTPPVGCRYLSMLDSIIVASFGDKGLFATRDFGTTWHDLSEPDVLFLGAVLAGDTVLAGTDLRGVWKRPYSELLQATQPVAAGRNHVRATTVTPTVRHGHMLVLDIAGRLVKRARADGRVQDVYGILSGLRPGTYVIRTASGTAKATAVTRY